MMTKGLLSRGKILMESLLKKMTLNVDPSWSYSVSLRDMKFAVSTCVIPFGLGALYKTTWSVQDILVKKRHMWDLIF